LNYCNYVNERNREVINGIEAAQDAEVSALKASLRDAKASVQDSLEKSSTEIATLARSVRSLQEQLQSKEEEHQRTLGDLDWCREKVSRLEAALQSATGEITRRTEECNKWEFKAGEQQQHLHELER
jgi:chromosome segregation ATPase